VREEIGTSESGTAATKMEGKCNTNETGGSNLLKKKSGLSLLVSTRNGVGGKRTIRVSRRLEIEREVKEL